jgi:hypothetical protein
MRWVGYAWTSVVNCFYLCVVLAVFAKLYDRPEAITAAILGLIYVAVVASNSRMALGTAQALMKVNQQILETRRLLKDVQFGNEAESFRNAEKTLDGLTPNYYINRFFLWLISLICLFVLGVKLLGS